MQKLPENKMKIQNQSSIPFVWVQLVSEASFAEDLLLKVLIGVQRQLCVAGLALEAGFVPVLCWLKQHKNINNCRLMLKNSGPGVLPNLLLRSSQLRTQS